LVQLGADLEAKDTGGRTPLRLAKVLGKHGAVEVLLELGAGVIAPDPFILALSASTVLPLLLFAL